MIAVYICMSPWKTSTSLGPGKIEVQFSFIESCILRVEGEKTLINNLRAKICRKILLQWHKISSNLQEQLILVPNDGKGEQLGPG